MSLYDNITNILKSNPLTGTAYNVGATIGKAVQVSPTVSTISRVPIVSIPVSIASATRNMQVPTFSQQTLNVSRLVSSMPNIAPVVASSVVPQVAIARAAAPLVKSAPQLVSGITSGYESINKSLSGITKQVVPSYQETGYMFNKLIADPTYGKLVKERTGLLPSENWIATTSPGAMTTGGYTVVQKNADGSETRTKYGFNTDGSLASNVMQGITGFAEGGWNMPRERPLDTALILASGGVGEVAAGTSIGAKILASPAARYGLIAGVGLYGGDVASRVAGVGDATADKSIYGMAKRLGGITTTEIAPGSVAISPLVKGVKSGIRSERIAKSIEKTTDVASSLGIPNRLLLPSGDIRISKSEMEIIKKMKVGSPEYMTAHSPKRDVGWVKGEASEIPYERTVRYEGIGDSKGGVFYNTGFIGQPREDVTFTHTHPVGGFLPDNSPVIGVITADVLPSHPDLSIHLLHKPPSENRVASALSRDTAYITVMRGVKTPYMAVGGDSRFVDVPRVSDKIDDAVNTIRESLPPMGEKILTRSGAFGAIDRLSFKTREIENRFINALNRDLFRDAKNEIEKRAISVSKYAEKKEEIADTVFRGSSAYADGREFTAIEIVDADNRVAKMSSDVLRNIVRDFGGDVTFHKINLITGEQQLVDYPVVSRLASSKQGLYKEFGMDKKDYYLPPGQQPVVSNQPAVQSKPPRILDLGAGDETHTNAIDALRLQFPNSNIPGPRKQRYNRKKKLVKTSKKSKTTKKRLIPQKKKPHLIVPKKKQQRSKQRTSLSTGTKIETKMARNVNRFLGW